MLGCLVTWYTLWFVAPNQYVRCYFYKFLDYYFCVVLCSLTSLFMRCLYLSWELCLLIAFLATKLCTCIIYV